MDTLEQNELAVVGRFQQATCKSKELMYGLVEVVISRGSTFTLYKWAVWMCAGKGNTVEPLYNGHLGTEITDHCREVAVVGRLELE